MRYRDPLQNNTPKFSIFHFPFSILVAAMLLLTACGYKPVSYYSKQIAAKPLYLEVTLSRKNPDSGVFLKDAMWEALQYRLGSRITDDAQTAERLKVSYRVVSLVALGYDAHGYVERYRVNLETHFDLLTGGRHIRRTIRTTHDADVAPSAMESSRAKREAIKACAVKAVDQFIAFMAAHAAKT